MFGGKKQAPAQIYVEQLWKGVARSTLLEAQLHISNVSLPAISFLTGFCTSSWSLNSDTTTDIFILNGGAMKSIIKKVIRKHLPRKTRLSNSNILQQITHKGLQQHPQQAWKLKEDLFLYFQSSANTVISIFVCWLCLTTQRTHLF